MKRRDFIKASSLASGALFVPQFITALTDTNVIGTHRKLVIIQLNGGNDGLNTVVPYQNDIYYKNRKSLSLSGQDLIGLNDDMAFNASLKFHQRLYEEGNLTILNSVGYPNPNRSHFRSTDIWHSASKADEYLSTGWIGRYIEENGLKNYEAIEIDDSLSLMLKGKNSSGIATKNPGQFYKITQNAFYKDMAHQMDDHLSEHNLGYLYKNLIQAEQSAKYIYEASKIYKNAAEYPDNVLSRQLKTISTFINSGLTTSVYYASLGGFDTHAGQIQKQNKLLSLYDNSIEAFVNDLKKQNTFKDTLIMVFSEFGRRVSENSGKGTDHGAANNVFIIGDKLRKPKFFNAPPDLVNLDGNGDIKYEIDFRRIYASLLEDWLQVDYKAVLGGKIDKIRLV